MGSIPIGVRRTRIKSKTTMHYLRRLYLSWYYFYHVFLLDLLVDIFLFTIIGLVIYYCVIAAVNPLSLWASVLGWASFYEALIWPMPLIYCMDWNYRLAMNLIFEWAEMQIQV